MSLSPKNAGNRPSSILKKDKQNVGDMKSPRVNSLNLGQRMQQSEESWYQKPSILIQGPVEPDPPILINNQKLKRRIKRPCEMGEQTWRSDKANRDT